VVSSLKPSEVVKLIRNYINAFDAELSDPKLLAKASYFEAIFEMFDEVLRGTLSSAGNLKQATIQDAIRALAKVDYTGRGTLTKKNYTELMQATFRKSVAVSADML
jgi:DNA sulfur modification protein DndB